MFIFLLNLIKSRSFNHFALQCYNNCNVYLGMNQFEVKLHNSKTDSDDGFILDLNYHSGLLGIDRAFLCNKYNKLDVCQLPKKNIFLIPIDNVKNGFKIATHDNKCLSYGKMSNELIASNQLTFESCNKKNQIFIMIPYSEFLAKKEKIIAIKSNECSEITSSST